MVPEHIVDRSFEEKTVVMIPAKASVVLTDYDICAIDEAVFESSIGLYSKYRHWISLDEGMSRDRTIVINFYKLRNDDFDISTKTVGRHLRNVTNYLKNNYPDIYDRLKSGPRIFNYGMM